MEEKGKEEERKKVGRDRSFFFYLPISTSLSSSESFRDAESRTPEDKHLRRK